MQRSIARIGFWASVIALVGAVGYVATVPLQILEWVTPLSNAYIAYAFSLIITVPFLISMLALHHTTPVEKQFWTHAAVSLAIIYVTLCALNYVVQMATVLPAGYIWTFDNLEGTRGPLSLLNQTPHSLFWDVDALGYIFLNLATIFASFAFERSGVEKWVRRIFLFNGCITPLFAVAYFYPVFSPSVLMFGLPWAVTVPACFIALAQLFRHRAK
ncbi:MAG: hypothetical protein JNM27_12730 [Leptospirales bacterium]|nr:hypothetical protein [Leptospirales bacterium]